LSNRPGMGIAVVSTENGPRQAGQLGLRVRAVDRKQNVSRYDDSSKAEKSLTEITSTFGDDFLGDAEASVGVTDEASRDVEKMARGTAVLVITRGPNLGSRFGLDQAVTSACRHPDSDIVLDDVTVSRRHAEFRRDEDGRRFWVIDAGSLNGTYVNRVPMDAAVLVSGDQVQLGKFRLVFLTSTDLSVTG
jgi:FHA domain-containing protein